MATAAGSAAIPSTIYVSHGSPELPDQDIPARAFLKNWANTLSKPRAILCVSAHWETDVPRVTLTKSPPTIHDFYGFPKHMYDWIYPARGEPQLAQRVIELLTAAGFDVEVDKKRGLDHGAWVPLMLMYPDADIPVVQLSIQPERNGFHHLQLGRALSSLKNEGVLVMGSGSATHNLRETSFALSAGKIDPSDYVAFDNWLRDALVQGRFDDVCDYLKKAPNPTRSHPTPDHFLPILVALGAAGENAIAKRVHTSWEEKILSMANYEFMASAAAAGAPATA